MAAATSIGRWLFSEAASGTGPTTVADDTGNGNTLQIDYSTGDAAWTSIAAGNGLDFTAASPSATSAVCYIANITSTGNIGSSLNNATECSFTVVSDFTTPSSASAFFLRIGSTSANGGYCSLTVNSSRRVFVQFGDEYDVYNGADFLTAIGTGVRVLTVVIETSQGTAANRVKVWDNNSALTVDYTDVALNRAMTDLNTYGSNFSIGNRYSAVDANIDGAIYYAELFTGVLTPTQVGDIYTALISDNDADWAAAAGSNANLLAGKLGGLLAGKL